MLRTADFDLIMGPLDKVYQTFADSILLDIARRLGKLPRVTATAKYQLAAMINSGLLYDDIVRRIGGLLGVSDREINRVFKEAGIRSLKYDNKVLAQAGITPLNSNFSPSMARVLTTGIAKTAGVVNNLTMTTAVTGQSVFTDVATLVYNQVSSGALDYTTALRRAVKDMSAKGVYTVDYATGRKEHADVALRRAVLTGVAQTTGQIQLENIMDMGSDLVATSAHSGARNHGGLPENHEMWQGRVFTLTDTPGYPNFYDWTGYGKVTGLCGVNCRHSFYPFLPGFTVPAYSDDELKRIAETKVKYNGKQMSLYDATQYQRKIERAIRAKKREIAALEVAGYDTPDEQAELKALWKTMRSFVNQTQLERQREREQVYE